MALSKAQLRLYAQGHSDYGRLAVREDDARLRSKHDRHNRGFVRVKWGECVIIFYPPKFWRATLSISEMTVRTWINHGLFNVHKYHHMHVMPKAELVVLRDAIKEFKADTRAHTDPAFIKSVVSSLLEVRAAYYSLRRIPYAQLTSRQMKLLEPSLTEKRTIYGTPEEASQETVSAADFLCGA
jgi:hypothetical protein